MTRRRLLAVATAVLSASSVGFAADYEPPRMSDGRPVLSGVWTNASLTTLTRPRSIPDLVLSPAEAAELAAGNFHNVRAAKDDLPLDPNRGAPEVLERLPPVGNYNASWVDPGSTYAEVRGEIRSSWIVDPADGQIPFREEVREGLRAQRRERATPDGPEVLSLGERCLMGFGGTAGPPMLNVLYNNFYRIVQTPDHVVIVVEMVHDARIIRLGSERRPAKHAPAANQRWLGDSIGHWEGDTLLIETRNFHAARAAAGPLYYSPRATVTERLTRVSEHSLLYEFEVDDPLNYTQVIRGEMSFTKRSDKAYEYACQEGNYAMGNILRGARLEESEAAARD